MAQHEPPSEAQGVPVSVGRRRFLTYLLAAPALTVATRVGLEAADPAVASAAVPSQPSVEDVVDIGDALVLASAPTMPLVQLEIGEDGMARLDLPRIEFGQGVTTSIAMLIAEELDVPIDRVQVTAADARPELLFNQITAGSSTVRAFYDPVRAMAAAARLRMLTAAGQRWNVPHDALTTHGGAVHGPHGQSTPYGQLSRAAATIALPDATVSPKPRSEHTLIGTPTKRLDLREIVTGQKQFTMDIMPTRAKPAMVKRPPTIKGTVRSVANAETVRTMSGVLGVVPLESGVAVVAHTFEQARAGANALDVSFAPGPIDDQSNDSIYADLRQQLPPEGLPPIGGSTVDAEFEWAPACHAPLETEAAVADVRPDSAEIWFGFQAPIAAQQDLAHTLGLPQNKVQAHVVANGGGFGRRCYYEVATEAAQISQAMRMPIRLMWHRADDMRHARVRPPTVQRIRATVLGGQVVSYEQRVSEVALSVAPGFGEMLTDIATSLPPEAKSTVGMQAYSQTLFLLEVASPYNLGAYTKTLHELGNGLPTAAYRSVHCPMTRTCEEIVVDEVAAMLGKDPLAYRKECVKDERGRTVLDTVAERAHWGKTMPPGFAQGIGYHKESRTFTACVAELDCRNPRDPNVTKITMVADIGLPINPSGLEAQLQGCVAEAISLTLRAGLHIKDGLPLEGSYHNYHWLRMKDYPADTDIHIMPPNGEPIGGAGEVGISASSAAIANAYAKATATKPRKFPLVFPVDFEPYPPDVIPGPEFEKID